MFDKKESERLMRNASFINQLRGILSKNQGGRYNEVIAGLIKNFYKQADFNTLVSLCNQDPAFQAPELQAYFSQIWEEYTQEADFAGYGCS